MVVDELGLRHGRGRADVAVINGVLTGFEIKSEKDSLARFQRQVPLYSSVFDFASAVIAERHLAGVRSVLPRWWGLLLSVKGGRGAIHFQWLRKPRQNPSVDPISIAQLLWRREAQRALEQRGYPDVVLRKSRSVLYQHLVEELSTAELRYLVWTSLMARGDWRHPPQLSRYDGSSRPNAIH